MAHSERTTRLARSIHKICDKIQADEFLTPGQIRFYNRLESFKKSRDQCVEDAQDLLGLLQVRQAGSSASGIEGTVEAIKGHVADVTEQVDLALDRHRAHKRAEQKQAKVNVTAATTRDVSRNHQPAPLRIGTAHARPQDNFLPPVDNSNTPFQPDFSHLLGIATDLRGTSEPPEPARAQPDDSHEAPVASGADRGSHRYPHPFATVLDSLPSLYPAWILEEPQPRPAFAFGPFKYVDTIASLSEMCEELSSVREFAVDLEHSDRSFLGFTCLMQISTRADDYIIDALALRSHLGAALAGPFADPQVLKVLHGADRDIEWLQKDFGLFVVNLFDTGRAARILDLPCGLGKLLNHFCNVSTDKSLQMADWRKRPLTKPMLQYARMDTHYLLYIADMLRLKLLQAKQEMTAIRKMALPVPGPQGLLGQCLEMSRQITLKLYEKPLMTPHSYIKFYQSCNTRLNQEQLSALAALFSWRDRKCRTLDDSPGRLLPKRLLLTLSQQMPVDVPGVLRIAGRHKLLIQHANEVAEVIAEGLKNPVGDEIPVIAAEAQGGDADAGSGGSAADIASLMAEGASDGSGDASGDASGAGTPVQVRQGAHVAEGDRASTPSGASDAVEGASCAAELSPSAAAPLREVGGKATTQSAGARGDVAEDMTGVEDVSFASLPSRKIKRASAGAGRRHVHEDASNQAPASSGVDVGTQPDAMGDSSSGQAQATMAAIFAEPIRRRQITVRKVGAAVSSLGGMFVDNSGAAVTVAPSQAPAAGSAPGQVGDATGEQGGRDKRAEVEAAVAALREDTGAADVVEGLEPGDKAAAGNGGEEEQLLSVRERYGRKRKADSSLLGDVTAFRLGERSGKAVMLRLRNQTDKTDNARGGRRNSADEDVQMFDYDAVLDGSDRLPSRQGRGRSGRGDRGRGDRGRGRGGRDSGRHGQQSRRQMRGDEHKSSKRAGIFEGRRGAAWNPYAVEAAETLGKRSGGSAPKSGNKSGNFRG